MFVTSFVLGSVATRCHGFSVIPSAYVRDLLGYLTAVLILFCYSFGDEVNLVQVRRDIVY